MLLTINHDTYMILTFLMFAALAFLIGINIHYQKKNAKAKADANKQLEKSIKDPSLEAINITNLDIGDLLLRNNDADKAIMDSLKIYGKVNTITKSITIYNEGKRNIYYCNYKAFYDAEKNELCIPISIAEGIMSNFGISSLENRVSFITIPSDVLDEIWNHYTKSPVARKEPYIIDNDIKIEDDNTETIIKRYANSQEGDVNG